MEIQSYRDLRVWQMAMDVAVAAYAATKDFPSDERYGLTAQIRRSAASVAANIAEGYGRDSAGAYANFLRVTQGSLKECETHLLLAERIGIVTAAEVQPLLAMTDEVERMLRALLRSIERHTDKGK